MARLIDTGRDMREVPREKWPFMPAMESIPLKVWLSNDYMAVLYEQRVDGRRRLTVNRTRRNGQTWRDGITWDELQRVKNETVGEETWCVECYPAQSKVVNVSNMRHLWVLDEPPETRFPREGLLQRRRCECRYQHLQVDDWEVSMRDLMKWALLLIVTPTCWADVRAWEDMR